jgi:AP-4 complex subunit mu-1
VEYRPNEKQAVWIIKKFMGGSENLVRMRITLDRHSPSRLNARREIGPVTINFEIPMYNVSNLQVRYLRIPEHARHSSYKYKRWVRYVTQSESYVCRI